MMSLCERVSVFWDFGQEYDSRMIINNTDTKLLDPAIENCCSFSGVPSADIVKSVRLAAHAYGQITVFKAYTDITYIKSSARSDLQLAGVSLVDCPHNGKKEVADRMMTVDIMVNAMDNPAPGTVILITGDRDFAYAISILRMRRYRVVVIAPRNHHCSIRNQASVVLDWSTVISSSTDRGIDDIPPHTPSVPTSASASEPLTVGDDGSAESALDAQLHGRSKLGMQHLLVVPQNANVDGQGRIDSTANSHLLPASTSFTSYAFNSGTTNLSIQDLRNESVSPDVTPALGLSQYLAPPFDKVSSPSTVPAQLESVAASTRGVHSWPIDIPASSPTPAHESSPPLQTDESKGMSMCLTRCISPVFAVLVDVIKEQSDDATQVLCSKITPVLKKRDPFLYEKAGVPGFIKYIELAVAAGVITQGGKGALRWISLLPSIQYADFLASAPARSQSIFPSSTSFNFSFPVTSGSPREVKTSASDPSVPERELDKPAQLEPVTTSISRGVHSTPINTQASSPTLIHKPSLPSQTNGSIVMNMCPTRCISPVFAILIDVIKEQSDDGAQVLRSKIMPALDKRDPFIYEKAGTTGFNKYIKLAIAAGVITQDGKGALRQISLLPSIQYTDFLASAPAGSESILPSSTSFNLSSPIPSCSPGKINTSARDPASNTPMDTFSSSGQICTLESVPARVLNQPTVSCPNESLVTVSSLGISPEFTILVQTLKEHYGGQVQVLYKTISNEILLRDAFVYTQAGVKTFKEYASLAVRAGIVIAGGKGGGQWMCLHPRYYATNTADSRLMFPTSSPTDQCPPEFSSLICNVQPVISDEDATCNTPAVSPVISSSPSSSTLAAPPTATMNPVEQMRSKESSEAVPETFDSLAAVLINMGDQDSTLKFLRDTVRVALLASEPQVFKRAGAEEFEAYIDLAMTADIVLLPCILDDPLFYK